MNKKCFRGLLLSPVLLVPFLASPVHACFEVDTSPSPYIWFTSAGSPMVAEIAIVGPTVQTAGVTTSDFCAVGLGHSGTLITAVTAVTVEDRVPDPDSPAPVLFPGLSFSSNGASTTDFTALDPSLTWAGFHSAVSSPLAAGDAPVIRFTVEVPIGTTLSDILADLGDVAFLGSDEANAVGNLFGTSQSIDGINGLPALPFCNDFENPSLDTGEICGNDTNPPTCVTGDVCIECSACVASSFAEGCKAAGLKGLSRNVAKKRLKCHVKAAKQGQPADPTCLMPVNIDLVEAIIGPQGKIAQSNCPQAAQLPPPASVDTMFDTAISALLGQLPLGTGTGANKCASRKLNAASLRLVNSLNCHSKALKRGQPVDPNCLTKTATKFEKKFIRATTPDCDPGQAALATVAARVDQWVTDTVMAIPPN